LLHKLSPDLHRHAEAAQARQAALAPADGEVPLIRPSASICWSRFTGRG